MSTIAVATSVTPKSHHASKTSKPCTSASCCSPSRLWKTIQLLINTDNRDEFRKLCGDSVKQPHVVRVILTSRLSNNPLVYKSTITIDRRLTDKFGKLSATDLNALEIALLQKHDHVAYVLLQTLKQHATPMECKQFLNHQWGKQGNTALHLAAFWGMSKLVRLMLEMEADPFVKNNRQLRPIDCATHPDTITLLEQKNQQTIITKRPSLLLKKAEKTMMRSLGISEPEPVQEQIFVPPPPSVQDEEDLMSRLSPLSFSSSSSSSSSSFDYHCWTPPQSPIPSSVDTKQEPLLSDLANITISDEKDDILFQRPGCFPQHLVDNKQNVSQKPKKVHFDPQIIVVDACIRGDLEEMIELENEVVLSEIRDLQNRSLLHMALMHGQEHLVEYLSDKVDINHADKDGWTCLHYAAALGLWGSLQFLLSIPDCDISARTNHGLRVEDCPESDFCKRKCKSK
ncbi:uncharacterized protein B0P05DRAFT_466725 [Gilbertella persicaria]|uniref:uncharacterized protein n=1 Tax=Gilbertella persicaria TaxID=101096 RepID=UPI00221F9564|nr:uncharacterized protein B0P05DRAFT_466725 [Gilbertella persicaria]KAI8084246.1 hypothetical protein B0P05DRAFT_466725 [Gilbertella persicaria]